ncbi:MAG: tyrosine-type recombinase/integrase [Natrinema limicola]
MTSELEPLEPREAKQLYLTDREDVLSAQTHQSHGYRIERFVEWCDDEGIDNLNDVTGRDIQRFKIYRKNQDLSTWTLKSQMDTLRVFIRFCESINGCVDGLSESINSPSTGTPGNRGTDVVPTEKAEAILAHLDKYRYASIQHVLFKLLWETGMRMGASRAIDLQHYHPREAYIEIRHNPESDTPLKNKVKGERDVALSACTCGVIDDYIDQHRYDVEDDYGRSPLFTTRHGRITKNTIRNYVYRVTRPCTFNGGECPHDRDPSDCEGMDNQRPFKCPSSTAPHSIRHGAITDYLNRDVEAAVVSERMNVTMEVIEEHYDHRSSREKMELRRQHLDF